ncbi:MAG TPA: serine protease [Paraburkholderia sp.]|jgi:S1-C subfamily serine protease
MAYPKPYRRFIVVLAVCLPTGAAMAQSILEPVMIAPSKTIGAFALEPNATGFFVNDGGDLLTARHVVEACQTLFVIKDGQVARASVKAVSHDKDLAVIASRIEPLLAASFAKRSGLVGVQPVFAAGYDALMHMPDRQTAMFNGFARNATTDRESGALTLMSSATHGASGSPVLDQAGLVVGLVTGRAEASNENPRAYVARSGAADYVIALSSDSIKTFLAVSNIPFNETDVPQLEPMQPHAPRAATLEAGILCGD